MNVFEAAIDELNTYKSYGSNWNGYGAKPFSDEVIQKSISLLNRIIECFVESQTEPDQIVPGPVSDGRIDIEVFENGNHTIFTVDSEEKTLTVCLLINGTMHEEVIKYDETDMNQWISLFV